MYTRPINLLGVVLCLSALMCTTAWGQTDTPTITPTFTPSPTFTPTFTPTDTPTATATRCVSRLKGDIQYCSSFVITSNTSLNALCIAEPYDSDNQKMLVRRVTVAAAGAVTIYLYAHDGDTLLGGTSSLPAAALKMATLRITAAGTYDFLWETSPLKIPPGYELYEKCASTTERHLYTVWTQYSAPE